MRPTCDTQTGVATIGGMPPVPRKSLVVVASLACAIVGLTGCSPAESTSSSIAPSTSASELAAPISLPECEGIVLAANETVDGDTLGACIVAAMLGASSGTQRVESSDGSSAIVDFEWNPDYSMHSTGDSGSTIIEGDTGWLMLDGRWIQEDPASEDPEVALATGTIQLVRAASDPRALADYFALSPTWTIVGEEPVPAPDAVVDSGWKIVPDTAFSVGPVAISDMAVWLTPRYLGAYTVSTGTAFGFTTTSSSTFMQWGKPVEIPDPRD